MGKILIIAEKPSAAKAIADALGHFVKQDGYFENQQYLLSWAIGHVIQLSDPEDYDPKLKRWNLQSLPIIPDFRLKANPKTKKQLAILLKLIRQASALINACDSGREGELIFRYIVSYAKATHLPMKRLWTASLTKEAIREAFAVMKPAAEYNNLYYAAECRSRGDWLVGINATRGFTCKYGELLSLGRVQTPTLALLVKRQQEIEAFVPSDYWEVFATFTDSDKSYTGKWFNEKGSRFDTEEKAKELQAKVKNQPATVTHYEEKEKKEKPPWLFDLTSLQRLCNRKFHFTAADTLKAAQSLYEKKLITYPRTDSVFLSSDLVPKLPAILRKLGQNPVYQELAQRANPSLVHAGNRRVVRDDLITDHHAIIPTEEKAGKLPDKEQRVYDLIVRRFLAQYYPDAIYHEVSITTLCQGETFSSKAKRLVDPGWKQAEGKQESKKEDEEETEELPVLQTGQTVSCAGTRRKKSKTQPPKPYTEDNLLQAMENAGKELKDEELKEAMKDRGLGTPATRASIIERLKQVGYIKAERKALTPTQKGRELIRLIEKNGPTLLLSPELTGEWEKRIADVQKGTYDPRQFMENIKKLACHIVEQVNKAVYEKITLEKERKKAKTEN